MWTQQLSVRNITRSVQYQRNDDSIEATLSRSSAINGPAVLGIIFIFVVFLLFIVFFALFIYNRLRNPEMDAEDIDAAPMAREAKKSSKNDGQNLMMLTKDELLVRDPKERAEADRFLRGDLERLENKGLMAAGVTSDAQTDTSDDSSCSALPKREFQTREEINVVEEGAGFRVREAIIGHSVGEEIILQGPDETVNTNRAGLMLDICTAYTGYLTRQWEAGNKQMNDKIKHSLEALWKK